MSAFRVVSLLVGVVVVCLCFLLPVSATKYHPDPTSTCYAPIGDSTYGNWVSDRGLWGLWGLESYSSNDYTVLCAWRGAYAPQPGDRIWGPWHGNPNDTNCDVHGTSFFPFVQWPQAGSGSVVTRANPADNRKILTSFKLGTSCDKTFICAGLCPGFTDNYDTLMEGLRADPTYEETNFTLPAENTNPTYPIWWTSVVSTINSTQLTVTIKDPTGVFPPADVSAVTSVQLCYGMDDACPWRDDESGDTW